MGIELGRVSGALLSSNLLRNGENLAFETDLLYLDVVTGRIGIKTSTPSRELLINNTVRTANLVVDTQADTPNLSFYTNTIQNVTGIIYIQPDQTTDPEINALGLGTANLRIRAGQLIENITLDSDINLSPSGTGIVHFTTDTVLINGDLHATGDITWDGDITLGDDNTDSVIFAADINSDLIPNTDSFYDIGSASNIWNKLYTVNTVAGAITAITITSNSIDLLLTEGHTIYVSVNGSDTNYGTHLHSTFRTIKKALSVAVAGDEIVIFPGVYSEIFPLTVPTDVSIRGTSLRSVVVKPTSGTDNKDAFLLNAGTTLSGLSIQDFYYDEINDTGYGVRFAPNFTTTTRSPYIQNVSVITASATLPAGKGALVDGSVASPSSNGASMLFEATTFITPNQDGITATNGVRIELINVFTYYANHGIYLLTGSVGFANQGVKFGAEIRSINCANVYGTYGVVADGNDTICYLTGHDFGFVGSGLVSTNDEVLVIQENEVVAINGGIIYYESIDHGGDYRIGDIFYVDQSTGDVSFNAQSIGFTADGSIVLEGPNGITSITHHAIQTGNIRIHNNDIDSLVGPVNFLAASSTTTLNTDVVVTGLVSMTGDASVHGNVFLGNEPYDVVTVAPFLTQTIKPQTNNDYTLGDTNLVTWRNAFLTTLTVDNVTQITNNTISTLTTDTDLRLQGSNLGKIQVTSTDVNIANDLTIDGTTTINGSSTLLNTEIQGTVTLVGDINQTGDTHVTGLFANHNISVTGALSYLDVPDINIQTNVISITDTDADLNIAANGTGGVILDQRIKITDNDIRNSWVGATTDAQKSLVFSPDGTGDLLISSTKSLKIPIGNNTNRLLSAIGEIRYNDVSNMVEAWQPSGYINFANLWDSDRNTYVTAELTPGANDNTLRFSIAGTVTATITSAALTTNSILVDDVKIIGNTISNNITSNNLEFIPTGIGVVNINDVHLIGNSITNNAAGAITFDSIDTGYVKFTGTNAVVLPLGITDDRRLLPEIGETRHNSELGYMEIFNGTIWQSAIGAGFASEEEVSDIFSIWALIAG